MTEDGGGTLQIPLSRKDVLKSNAPSTYQESLSMAMTMNSSFMKYAKNKNVWVINELAQNLSDLAALPRRWKN
jgi:hypothetical protein